VEIRPIDERIKELCKEALNPDDSESENAFGRTASATRGAFRSRQISGSQDTQSARQSLVNHLYQLVRLFRCGIRVGFKHHIHLRSGFETNLLAVFTGQNILDSNFPIEIVCFIDPDLRFFRFPGTAGLINFSALPRYVLRFRWLMLFLCG
jgi:hypothetical protein